MRSGILVGLLLALGVTHASASCLPRGTDATRAQELAAAVLLRPQLLLDQNPGGGGALTRDVRLAVGTSPSLAAAILGTLAGANPLQKSAIATGLGQAALLCQVSDPVGAQAVQTAVATVGDAAVEGVFRDVTGGVQTAATGFSGAPANVGPASVPGLTGPFTDVPGRIGSNLFANGPTPFTASAVSGGTESTRASSLRSSVSP
jgi:hypothetical protein